jgi:hypothetical protein
VFSDHCFGLLWLCGKLVCDFRDVCSHFMTRVRLWDIGGCAYCVHLLLVSYWMVWRKLAPGAGESGSWFA